MTTIGFIGLGIMGAPMARNLVAAGYELQVFDVNAEAAAAFDGATAQPSAKAGARLPRLARNSRGRTCRSASRR